MSYEIGTGDLQRQVSPLPPTAATAPVQTTVSTSPADASERPAVDADHTNLSSLGGLVAQALETSDTRTAKVASLQQAISSGQYNISSSDVAEKLIQSLLE
jgi:negative regulator of flagellin synthesis FlgM